MKVASLSLCILTGVVDSQDNGVFSVIVNPAIDGGDPLTVTLTGEYLPPDTDEGDSLTFTILADEEYSEYCQVSL